MVISIRSLNSAVRIDEILEELPGAFACVFGVPMLEVGWRYWTEHWECKSAGCSHDPIAKVPPWTVSSFRRRGPVGTRRLLLGTALALGASSQK